jgi:pSer/pThr/pTyr-binding forkhead associated (FHA) protein
MIACSCGHENTTAAADCEACGRPLPLRGATGAVSRFRRKLPKTEATGAHAMRVPDEQPPAAEPMDEEAEPTLLSAAPLPLLPEHCTGCGEPVEPAWRFCKSCGAPTAASAAATVVQPASGRAAAARRGFRHELRVVADDGVRAGHVLKTGRTVVGRSDGDIVLEDDVTLSARHAVLEVDGGRCTVSDLDSTNGTFVAVRGEEEIVPGDVLLVGGKRLLLRQGARGLELVEMRARGREGRAFPVRRSHLVLGKDGADVDLGDDEFISHRHAEILRTGRGLAVRDLGSVNGTHRLVKGSRELADGDRIVMGEQVFEYRRAKA